MPITTSAKKAMRQAKARLDRRKPYKSRLKSEIKKFLILAKTDPEKAKKLFTETQSVIDTACKKNIIHKNNAARKKSRLSLLLAKGVETKKTAAKK